MSYQDFLRQQALGKMSPLQRVMGVLGGPNDPTISPEQNAQRAAQQRMAMAASLLQNSGPTPKGTTGPLQPFGYALQAGQQAGAAATQQIQNANADQLRAKLMQAQFNQAQSGPGVNNIDPDKYEPESVQKFLKSGDYQDLKPRTPTHGRYLPGNYTAESWAMFEETGDPNVLEYRPQYQFGTTPGGGRERRNPLTGEIDTIVTPEEGTAEAAARAEAEARARERGGARGKAEGALLAKAAQSGGITDILEIADPLIDEATGSGSGAIRDQLLSFFGESTEGDQAIGQLRVLQAALMMAQPRMEGPQSDRDVELYRQAAAELGDPTVPRARKKAALETIRELQIKYAGKESASGGSATRRVRVDGEGNVIAN